MAKINVQQTAITLLKVNEQDYISLTDIARYKSDDPTAVIGNWMRNRNTIEYLGIWETLYNPGFKPLEFDGFRKEAGLNAFTLSPQKWINTTGAIGIVSRSGRYGGTFAHKDIAFKFASWISVEFELYLVKEFQRLKEQEQADRLECEAGTVENQLSHPHRCHQAESHSAGDNPGTSLTYLRQRSRCAEHGTLRNDRLGMARQASRFERQHPRLCVHQRIDMPVEHGEPECGVHTRQHPPTGTAHPPEPHRHTTDASVGGSDRRA